MSNTPGLVATIKEFAAGLRFPTLFAITAALFAVDLVVPDIVPFADEILLALGTLLLGSLRKKARAGISGVDSDGERPATPAPGSENPGNRR